MNSRYLDINIRMPKAFMALEEKIKKQLGQTVARGKVDMFLNYRNKSAEDLVVTINEGAAEKYVEALRDITMKLGIHDDIATSFLLELEGVVTMQTNPEDLDSVWALISSVLSEAMAQHDAMRLAEGSSLKQDLLAKSRLIRENTARVKELSEGSVDRYREKLTQRLAELDQKLVDDDRIAQEVAIFADRASIDEEITRLYSHMEQLEEILELDEPVGRKLDFLAQEMNREANTMASKAVDLEVTELVLNIKSEIEKIREQIQNIE